MELFPRILGLRIEIHWNKIKLNQGSTRSNYLPKMIADKDSPENFINKKSMIFFTVDPQKNNYKIEDLNC